MTNKSTSWKFLVDSGQLLIMLLIGMIITFKPPTPVHLWMTWSRISKWNIIHVQCDHCAGSHQGSVVPGSDQLHCCHHITPLHSVPIQHSSGQHLPHKKINLLGALLLQKLLNKPHLIQPTFSLSLCAVNVFLFPNLFYLWQPSNFHVVF